MSNIDFKALAAPFKDNEIEWRVGATSKDKKTGLALAYVDNRAIMDRLDEVCGAANWKNEYRPGVAGGVMCGLSIRVDAEWVTKWDAADNTEVEPVKGGMSDAMKRAAVHWGIGRYLYDADDVWVELQQAGNTWVIPKSVKAGLKVKINGQPVNAPASPQRQPPPPAAARQELQRTDPLPPAAGESPQSPAHTTPPAATPPAKVERPYAADVLITKLQEMAAKSKAPVLGIKEHDNSAQDYAIFSQNHMSDDLRYWLHLKTWGNKSSKLLTDQQIDAMRKWLNGEPEIVEAEVAALKRMMLAEKAEQQAIAAPPDSDAAFNAIKAEV